MKYKLAKNEELEGYDLLEKEAIETEDGKIDAVVATFFDFDKALEVAYILNNKNN